MRPDPDIEFASKEDAIEHAQVEGCIIAVTHSGDYLALDPKSAALYELRFNRIGNAWPLGRIVRRWLPLPYLQPPEVPE
jgi:hypothetical protein